VSLKGTTGLHSKVISLSANKLRSFLSDLAFRKEFKKPTEKNKTIKVQIHDEIFSCNFGLMIQKFREQLNLIVETLVRDMKH
jgi:hypothetical protein